MPGRLIIAITLVLGLSACSTGWNPLNWFKNSSDGAIALIPEGGFPVDNDFREVVTQVTEMKILRASGGALIQVTGLPPSQGYWAAELVPENDERPDGGVLTYTFRVYQPSEPTATGTAYSRKVLVAHFVSDAKLVGVSQIRVLGAENSRIARR